jgi:predicted ester cyclase
MHASRATLGLKEEKLSTPQLVNAFYQRIWNAGDLDAADGLLSDDFSFRGSLGNELRGREAFKGYVRSVRNALDGFRCDILEGITEDKRAFAKMRFSGVHTREFRGHAPTGCPVYWLGAAFFRFDAGAIADLWVLGDLAGLDALLKENQKRTPESAST